MRKFKKIFPLTNRGNFAIYDCEDAPKGAKIHCSGLSVYALIPGQEAWEPKVLPISSCQWLLFRELHHDNKENYRRIAHIGNYSMNLINEELLDLIYTLPKKTKSNLESVIDADKEERLKKGREILAPFLK